MVAYQNGIDVDNILVRTLSPRPEASNHLHLVGVANVTYWHGYDRVISGLQLYYSKQPSTSLKKIYFHIVGGGSDITHLKKLVQLYGLSE